MNSHCRFHFTRPKIRLLESISEKFLSAILPFWKPVSVEGRVKKLSLFEGLGPSLTILALRNGNAKMANQKRKKVF
jgi:hypothetical protein